MTFQRNKEGDLKIYWMPQLGMSGDYFYVRVPNIDTAMIVYTTLAEYDLYQFENNIKPDYCNTGGLLEYRDRDWRDWEHPETGDDIGTHMRELEIEADEAAA